MSEKNLNQEEIGLRIKIIRNELGLTMKEFGQKFDPPASDSIVSRWERGKSSPNSDRLQRIADLGNVSLFYLTTGRKTTKDLSPRNAKFSSDKDIREVLHGLKDSLKKAEDNNKKAIAEDFKRIEIDKLDFVETIYLINVLNFLRYSDKEDIISLTGIINTFNIDIEEEEFDQEEIKMIIDTTVEEVRQFLEKRFNYKGGE